MSTPLRACRPRLTAAQGPRVEQRAILARIRCARCAGERAKLETVRPSPYRARCNWVITSNPIGHSCE